MMGALAEFERSLISERTKAGMAAARARGAPVGRPAKLNGAEIDAAAAELRHFSLTTVAQRLDVFAVYAQTSDFKPPKSSCLTRQLVFEEADINADQSLLRTKTRNRKANVSKATLGHPA